MAETRSVEVDNFRERIAELEAKRLTLQCTADSISWGYSTVEDAHVEMVNRQRWERIQDTIRSIGAQIHSVLDEWEAYTKKRKLKVGNGVYQGPFAFTLTKSPKDPYTVGDMLTAVRKVMHQKSCPVIKYAWYYEDKGRDDNGDPIHPHIHGMYETATGGRIETRHWKRAWRIWNPDKPLGAGFVGGYHRPVRDGEGYSNYIKKDGGMGESNGFELTE